MAAEVLSGIRYHFVVVGYGPKMSAKETHRRQLPFRVTEEEAVGYEQCAVWAGVSRERWIREVLGAAVRDGYAAQGATLPERALEGKRTALLAHSRLRGIALQVRPRVVSPGVSAVGAESLAKPTKSELDF